MNWTAAGAFTGALAVAIGALGAHALKETLGPEGLDLWRTAAHYQGLHAVAMVVFGLEVARRRGSALPGWCFLVGTLCFSGSIYGLALDGPKGLLGPVTPLGGLLFIVGWVVWGAGALRGRSAAPTTES